MLAACFHVMFINTRPRRDVAVNLTVNDPDLRDMIGCDGHLDQSYASDLGQFVWEYQFGLCTNI